MPLDDARIVRYGRQILLPEVGGRGQERLLGSTVGVVGAGDGASWAALLLARSGIGRLRLTGAATPTAAPDCAIERCPDVSQLGLLDVAVWFGVPPSAGWSGSAVWAAAAADGPVVFALPGGPCVHCVPDPPTESPPADPATTRALAALAAAEALRLLLAPRSGARRSAVATPTGFVLAAIDPASPCVRCPCAPRA